MDGISNMNRKIVLLFLFIFALFLFIWAPWLSEESAGNKAVSFFENKWQGVADGCGFNCGGCGINDTERSLFGYTVELEYACGLLPADLPEYHNTGEYFISVLGTVSEK